MCWQDEFFSGRHQAREKGIVGGKDHGRYRNKLQWDGRVFSSDWWGPRDKKRVDPWSPIPPPSPTATQAWSRMSLSRLQSSFFSEGQLDEANSLSRIPWLKLYWSPLLHVKIDIYDALHHEGFFFFFVFLVGVGVGTVCQIFIRDADRHFSFLLPRHPILCSTALKFDMVP